MCFLSSRGENVVDLFEEVFTYVVAKDMVASDAFDAAVRDVDGVLHTVSITIETCLVRSDS